MSNLLTDYRFGDIISTVIKWRKINEKVDYNISWLEGSC